jgi:hypothetical protein
MTIYRTKVLEEKFLWDEEPSCLDSAYERDAIEKGWDQTRLLPVFPENRPDRCRRITKNGA